MSRRGVGIWAFGVVVVGLALIVTFRIGAAQQPAVSEQALAKQILEATGVKGGLIVHVGCGDGKLTAALRANDSYLVQGLDRDAGNVERARAYIRSQSLYGPVSADRLLGDRLPYADNLVNLVVSEDLGGVSMQEVQRVLAPNGVAYVRAGGQWTKTVKPRPGEIDEWTHYLHDSTNNPVSHDTVVGPPRQMQWVGGPRWSRHHDHMASMSALVSANGRVFYIVDEGPTASIQWPPKWNLVARDAFNGTLLWKRPIASWNTHRWALKSGPAQLPRRLVAVGDTVYVTLALDAPVTALDAATGQTIRTFEGTQNTEEIICSDGVLFLLVNDAPSRWPEYRNQFTYVWDNTNRANSGWPWDEKERWVVAAEAGSGKILWRKQTKVAPLTLAANQTRVFLHDGEKVVCLDRKSGDQVWASEPVSRRSPIPACFGPTLVLYKDVVLFSGGDRKMCGLAADTGKVLWSAPHPRSGHQSPEDLIVIADLAWAGEIANTTDSGVFTGRDIHTGEVKVQFPPDVKTYWFHHRCYRSKATDRYILSSRTGIEFIDFQAKHWETHHWVRGGCIYGIMPCNGLVYAPPQSCGCYLESKLYGMSALAPAPAVPSQPLPDDARLERGPAYGQALQAAAGADEWPTYRHDPARSGATQVAVQPNVKLAWEAKLGGRLSSVVVAEGKLFVASVDTHTVYALDAASGKVAWSYTAGGRVDSPPTVYQGRVLFGSADGWVYCLRASDGALIWRFLAAPTDRRMVAFDQVESVWPVHGSVLVQDGVVYCVAGRSVFLDGGLHLLRLDPATGKKLSESVMDDRDPETGSNLQVHVKGLTMPVALPDILSSDGQRVYMRSQQFDMQGKRLQVAPIDPIEQEGVDAHLFCNIGFLDDSWFHRSFWEYGRAFGGGYGGWYRSGRFVPSGRILVFDDSSVYGYGRRPEYYCNASVLEYLLYGAQKTVTKEDIQRVMKATGVMDSKSDKKNANSSDWKLRQGFPIQDRTAVTFRWAHDQPGVMARAMALAGPTLFVAGPPDVVDEQEAFLHPDDPKMLSGLAQQSQAFEGQMGGVLWAVSAADGAKLAEQRLDFVPAWDGMAAANGRLYLSTLDGRVVCMG